MIKHPIYLLLCTLSAGYLFMADARGVSFWHGVSNRLLSTRGWGGGGAHSTFSHK